MSEQVDFEKLLDLITTRFNTSELRNLCYSLDVDYDNLAGEEKTGKARELILHQKRHNRFQDLVDKILELRPDITLQDITIDTTTTNQSAVTPNQPEIFDVNSYSNEEKESTKQPLSASTYILISATAFIFSIALLLFMVFFGPRLLQQGMNQQVFYILLIPLGLSTAAFVFGGMRSYATYSHATSFGTLNAAGPIVAAILVVLGGFYLVPSENNFDLTIRINTPDGPVREGEVVLIVGTSTLRQPINSNGEAEFKALPMSFIENPVRIGIWNTSDTRIKEVESVITGELIEISMESPPPTPIPPAPTPTPLPEQSFNIAVAEFSMLGADGEMSSSEISRDFSNWLFNFIDGEARKLSGPLSFQTRGPAHIPPILGKDQSTREMNAAMVAEINNATILTYGFIKEEDEGNGPYSVNLEFYVSDEAFSYGSEVAGPDRLGQPVPFALPLEDSEQTEINKNLFARVAALKQIVEGLSNYYFGYYEKAAADFNWAATRIQEWSEEDGKEVAFLLEGMAWFRAYDPCTNADLLQRAQTAFENAYELDDQYARNFLGLASIAVQEATQYENCEIITIDQQKIEQAEELYLYSLRLVSTENPDSVYIPVKANYGLGQIYLLNYEHGPGEKAAENWQKAENAFENVVTVYYNADEPFDLAWFAAGAFAQLGLLAGHNGDWETMIDLTTRAIEILDSLPDDSVRNWIARYWSWIALAENRRGQGELARQAYEQAIDIGKGYVSDTELEEWQKKLEELG